MSEKSSKTDRPSKPDTSPQPIPSEANKPSPPSETQKPTSKEKLISEITTRLEAAQKAQEKATSLRSQAGELPDSSTEKTKLLDEATKEERKSVSELKIVKRLQSGPWQGGATGAGMGVGVGMGVGTLVGGLVGGVVSVPTTVVGGLVGLGTGAIHGPWVKIPGLGGEGEKKEVKAVATEGKDGEDGEIVMVEK